jgi:hypothetical protein
MRKNTKKQQKQQPYTHICVSTQKWVDVSDLAGPYSWLAKHMIKYINDEIQSNIVGL